MNVMVKRLAFACAALIAQFTPAAAAEQIVVSNYGVAANGMPYRDRDGKGLLQAGGCRRHRHHSSSRRRHDDAQPARRRLAYRRGRPGRNRRRDPARRRSEDRQRQCAHRRRIRLGGEARFADQDAAGFQGRARSATPIPRSTSQALDVLLLANGRHDADRRGPGEGRRLRRAGRGARTSARSTSRRWPIPCGRRTGASCARSCGRPTCCRRCAT